MCRLVRSRSHVRLLATTRLARQVVAVGASSVAALPMEQWLLDGGHCTLDACHAALHVLAACHCCTAQSAAEMVRAGLRPAASTAQLQQRSSQPACGEQYSICTRWCCSSECRPAGTWHGQLQGRKCQGSKQRASATAVAA